MSSSFPANVQRATVIVRLERRARPKLRPGQKSTVAEQKLEAVRRKKLGKYEDEPGGDLALSCTVVFRGGYGGGTSSGGYSLASTTCRCVLPFPAIAKRIEVPGLGPNVSALDIVRAGKRDELIDAVLSRLRLAMLCPSKFARAVPLSEVSSGAHELQLLFDWQRPKRDLIVGDPVDDKIVKFLAPHQREMIRLYREAMVSLLPSERPPSSQGEEKEEEQPAANADADRLQLEKTAAVRIQSRARQWMARERVEALRNLRDDEGMVFTSESDSEEVESADEDSDAEEVINVRFRMHQACHLNGKLVDLRMRVCDVAGGLNKEEGGEGSSVDMHTAIHVKVVEPKGRKIARICVEGEKLDSVLDRSLPDTDESPLSTVAAVEAGDPLAVMCVKLFHALQLFQSRARGILLLKVKEDAELSDEGKDGGDHASPSRSKNGAYVESKQDDAKRGGVLALERKLSTQKSLTSLAHSPMVTRSAEEGDAVESTGKAFRKTLSPHDPTLSPPMPSAPKASRGAPPTLDESTVGDEDLDEEEALKTYRPEVIMAAAARNWRPDSAVERPDEVPTLPLKKIKSRRRY